MHTGEGGVRGYLVYPLKRLEKFEHKNAIKHKNRGPPPRFSHNPMCPLKRI
jgi:hypothetical protein